jgi:hypothetical protein
MKKINFLNKNLIYLLYILILATLTSFFTNIYSISVRKYDERLIRLYGFCDGVSYGFIKKINEKYLKNNQKIYIINFETFPPSYGLFPKIKIDNEMNNLVLLNYSNNKINIIKSQNVDLKNYKMIYSEDRCYFYKKIIK